MIKIATANQKGGVGKSTTSQSLGAGLKLQGLKVLLVDLDPQGNLTYSCGGDSSKPVSSYSVITRRALIEDAIQKTESGDLIISSPLLSNIDNEMSSVTGKEFRIEEALKEIENKYDVVIMDTPPALGILTVNALTAANMVIIPSSADSYSLQGIGQLHNTIETVKRYCNSKLRIAGILLTRHNDRTILARDLAEMIKDTAEKYGTIVFETSIRDAISIKESQSNRTNIFAYDPKSNPAIDYMEFINELRKKEGF